MIRNILISALLLATAAKAANINICENVADKIFLEDVTNCTKYYLCMNGQPQSRYCANGLFFNAESQACTDNKTSCLTCPQGQIKMVPLARTCNKYVLCYDGTPVIQSCYDDLQFNPDIGKCDFATKVGCVDNYCSVYDNNVLNLKYVPSPNNCSNYYICMNGIAQPFSCATGLHFSTNCNCCDFVDNANCTIAKSKTFDGYVMDERPVRVNTFEGKHTQKKTFREPIMGDFPSQGVVNSNVKH
ncbi:peritrophin-44 isoform X2 [Stomoxys calcitrans]|uniref:peritrophin-44 isoform X2 n=1 Tax=Stomoxys calcitrans TaxID=35570 RepID=UPI0027E3837E|nr:peritrophin-44 isoform X2 [Stomoxys calcitrans]